jgi:glycosyltransferase involved in cell wall biosynthesis
LQELLLFAYYFPPENESGAKRPYRFVRYLERHGYRTRVITASRQRGEVLQGVTEVPGEADWKTSTRLYGRIAAGIQRILPCNDQLAWAPYAAAEARALIAEEPPAAILSTSPPLACQWAALELKLRSGIPWVADLRDPIYGNPHRKGALSRMQDALLERLTLRHADAVIANTDTSADAIRSRHPRFSDKVHVIWNGYDPAEPLQALPRPPRDHRIVLHTGSIYAGRHPGALLASLARLIARGRLDPASIRLRLMGWLDLTQPWASSPECRTLLQSGSLEYANEVVPEPAAIRAMAEADYLLLLDGNEASAALQVPAKLFQYIRIGRPILAFTARNSPSERILAASGIPHVAVSQDDAPERIDEGVAALFQIPPEPSRPSEWFEQQFDAERQTRSLAAILQTVTERARKRGVTAV